MAAFIQWRLERRFEVRLPSKNLRVILIKCGYPKRSPAIFAELSLISLGPTVALGGSGGRGNSPYSNTSSRSRNIFCSFLCSQQPLNQKGGKKSFLGTFEYYEGKMGTFTCSLCKLECPYNYFGTKAPFQDHIMYVLVLWAVTITH